jgi:hypothetical protein
LTGRYGADRIDVLAMAGSRRTHTQLRFIEQIEQAQLLVWNRKG